MFTVSMVRIAFIRLPSSTIVPSRTTSRPPSVLVPPVRGTTGTRCSSAQRSTAATLLGRARVGDRGGERAGEDAVRGRVLLEPVDAGGAQHGQVGVQRVGAEQLAQRGDGRRGVEGAGHRILLLC